MNRRHFVKISALTAPVLTFVNACTPEATPTTKPIVISTWEPNKKANAEAWKTLSAGGRALDAVHAGVQIPEADPDDQSVGYGGLPDRDGKVTLDACIMDELGNCGAVMALENIMHPISVAKMVMEKTPHVILAGNGALQFALEQGFKQENLLTDKTIVAWKQWLQTSKYDPLATVENIQERIKKNHDTIGMIALDSAGNLSGACTTSGMAYKLHGRVGDSPIIGAGLFVDNEIGAATSTGVGEEVVRICGSHVVVEMMRQGKSPEDACKEAVERMIKLRGREACKKIQVGFIALNKKGEYGGYCIQKGFTYAVKSNQEEKVYESKFILEV
ncbi:MAG: N(4)-(beta-N-acetylglucosaminyl)-L-asparaginase [Chitinophagaceae bacterium]